MNRYNLSLILAGAAATALIGAASTVAHGPAFIAGLEAGAVRAIAGAGGVGITASFEGPGGWLSRHAVLAGGDNIADRTRLRVANAVAALPGVGGVQWAQGNRQRAAAAMPAINCQDDVNAILKARTIRFAEASAAIDPASGTVLDEVAAALRPCAGSITAIIGHTDTSGEAATNMALSQQRAQAVMSALFARGIPPRELRAAGMGAEQPLDGLDPSDPANRRIEFSVIAKAPLLPTPVDTPGAG